MASKRTTRQGQVATAPAPSASTEPVLSWIAHLSNGREIKFTMTQADLFDALDRPWFQLDSGTILVVSGIVLIGVQGKA